MMRSGTEVPDRFLNGPEVPPHLQFYFDAFYDLSTCRSSGMGPGPIPITAILTYGQYYECDRNQMHYLIKYVRQMDEIWMEHQEKQSERARRKK